MVVDIEDLGEDGRIRNRRKKTQCERGDSAPKWSKQIIFPTEKKFLIGSVYFDTAKKNYSYLCVEST